MGLFLNTDAAIVQCRICGKSRKVRPVCPVLIVHAISQGADMIGERERKERMA